MRSLNMILALLLLISMAGATYFFPGNVTVESLAAYTPHLSAIAGGPAGNHTLTGVRPGDVLAGVICVKDDSYNNTAVTDITSQFSGAGKGIIAANTIANGGGTNTAGGYLIVSWLDRTPS